MPVTVYRCVPWPPDTGITEPTLACSSCALVGASTICPAPAGIRPAVSTTGIRFPATGAML